jgi:hypothetical protein
VIELVERLAGELLDVQVERLEADQAGDRSADLDRGVADHRFGA